MDGLIITRIKNIKNLKRKIINIKNDQLVIENKGIHSIEKFLIARTIMYWQVYLHKTVLSAEFLLVKILEKVKELKSDDLFATPALKFFLENSFTLEDFKTNPDLLEKFSQLDDYDILTSIKVWCHHENKTLASLCNNLIDRRLFGIKLQNEAFSDEDISSYHTNIDSDIPKEDYKYFVFSENIKNTMYNTKAHGIGLLQKDGSVIDISEASEHLNLSSFSQSVNKHFICYPKNNK